MLDTLTREPTSRTAHAGVDAAAQADRPCRLVLADDHPLYRDGIVRALHSAGGFDVVGEADDGHEALTMIRRLRPDLALLDVRMPLLDGVDVVHALALRGPDVPVVLLSAFSDEQLVHSALEAGAAGYLTKGEDRDTLCERLRVFAERGPALAPNRLSPHDPIGSHGAWVPCLTVAEHQLLQLARGGLDKLALAAAIGVSESEIRLRVAALTRKLDCDSLADAVEAGRSAGLIR